MTTNAQGRLRRRRAKLFKNQGGKCHWCQCDMLFIHTGPHDGRLPKNMCTIDHLRDRFHPERRAPAKGDQRLVAACWQCNNDRGKVHQQKQPIEELWHRAGHLDRMMGAPP